MKRRTRGRRGRPRSTRPERAEESNGKVKAISKKPEQLQELYTNGKAGTAQELRHQELQQQELIHGEHS
eukprot:3591871-Pyramimonas_sp.AAC.1